MDPLYFGDANERLLGIRHPAQGIAKRTAILICPSWGMEYLRSYRGLRGLAQLLATQGFEVLRFDYSGTGDSAGDSRMVSWERWLSDTIRAARELRELSGAPRLALFGLRFGALVASAAAEAAHAQNLVLWDLPLSGAAYVDEMRSLQASLEAERSRLRTRSAQLPPPAPNELLGHAWPVELDAALRKLWPPPPALPCWSIRSAGTAATPNTSDMLLAEAAHWNTRQQLSTPWNPQIALRRCAQLLAERLA